jgi:hypothetical protein
MSANCRFCGQEFANAQAVRAHLKGCAAYQARPGKSLANAGSLRHAVSTDNSLGNEDPNIGATDDLGQSEKPFDPVHQLKQRLATERIRLQLREVEEAHAELDRRTEAKARERQEQAEQKATVERLAARDRENGIRAADEQQRQRESREALQAERQRRRREIIQSVKQQVVEQWFFPVLNRSDLKARILRDIETELASLPVADMPRVELVLIAEGIRDRLSRGVVQAEQSSRDQAAKRQRLIEHGCSYAARELRETDGLPITAIWQIEKRVREELGAVQGDETTGDIENWVDDVLDNEGVAWDDEDDD